MRPRTLLLHTALVLGSMGACSSRDSASARGPAEADAGATPVTGGADARADTREGAGDGEAAASGASDGAAGDAGAACASRSCYNGGTCVDAAGMPGCRCLPGYSGATCELPAVKPASGIACPSSGRPADGWPLVFSFNGNCFRSVNASGLAADPVNELLSSGQACAVAVAYGDLHKGADVDALIRTTVVPLITYNRGLVNTQKIGAIGFSAGGTVAAYLGSQWGKGIDPSSGTDYAFRVGAVVDLYGPLRLDRTHATDATGALTGGGGLLYLHETRSAGVDVDIPGVRQWSASSCFCAARGTSPCSCKAASATYLAAYQPAAGTCSFDLDDASLTSMSATAYLDASRPAHVAALYFCSGWKDSNVDHDMNLHQAVSYWRPEHLVTVRVDDGHGFPLSVCESSADAAGETRPLAWMIGQLSVFGDYPPLR